LLRDGARLLLKTEDILNRYSYSHAESLSLEALHRAQQNLRVDMHFLDRLGVIELIGTAAQPKTTEIVPPPRENQPARTTKSSKSKKKKTEPTSNEPEKITKETVEKKSSASAAALSSLSPIQLAVMEAIPDEQGITADALASIGYPYGEIVSALTMLEILGLIQKLPGAIYVKI